MITSDYAVRDGIAVDEDAKTCQNVNPIEFTYNSGLFLHGSAVLYNYTGNDTWKARTNGLLNRTQVWFLNETVIFEPACEPYGTCAVKELNMLSFKGYMLRFLTATTQVAPWTYDPITKIISDAASAAVKKCTAKVGTQFWGLIYRGVEDAGCLFDWVPESLDRRQVDVGSHMDALSAVMYNLVRRVKPPATSDNRGTSTGDPNAGIENDGEKLPQFRPITTGDKAGAGILTAIVVSGIVASSLWVTIVK